MRKTILLALGVMVLASSAAAQLVAPGGTIPAVAGTVSGANGTLWRSNVSILNLSSAETSVVLVLYPEIINNEPVFDIEQSDPISIGGNGQLSLANVATSLFGKRGENGALSIFSTNGAPLLIASKTYTPGPEPQGGTFGLNVYGVLVTETQEAWIADVQHDGLFRTNVGIFTPLEPLEGQALTFTIEIYDEQGTEVASGSLMFNDAGLKQKNLTFFGVDDPLLGGWVKIRCNDPSAIWYGYSTVIDQTTGDSVYRPAVPQQY